MTEPSGAIGRHGPASRLPAPRSPRPTIRQVPTRIDHQCSARECARKEIYVLEARCFNCQWEGEIAVTVGHEVSGTGSTARCPRCECRRIHNGNFIGREAPADTQDDAQPKDAA